MMQSMKTILEHTSLRALGAFVTDTSVPLEELLGELSLKYNRVRQSAITQEITEISAGARAQRNHVRR